MGGIGKVFSVRADWDICGGDVRGGQEAGPDGGCLGQACFSGELDPKAISVKIWKSFDMRRSHVMS